MGNGQSGSRTDSLKILFGLRLDFQNTISLPTKFMNYDLETIRSQFPALAVTDKGQPRVYLDNPAGTQVPVLVIQRMSDYLIH